MTKIEEVARAQAEAIFGKGCPLDPDDYVRARAAIEAMREPTPAMIDALNRARMAIQGGYEVDSSPWEAAIDAALSEEE